MLRRFLFLLFAFTLVGTARAGTPLDGDERYELLDIDTLFYIENRGLTRIHVDLNGHRFKLVTDPAEIPTSRNAFLIPENGKITINIAPYMIPGVENYMQVDTQGPPGTDADLIIANVLLPGQEVAYYIRDLEEIPEAMALLQSYPNPFQGQVSIQFSIPSGRIAGVPVLLAVYDITGRQVRLLADGLYFPGQFTVIWDGTGADGKPVRSGVYLAMLRAGSWHRTVRMIRVAD